MNQAQSIFPTTFLFLMVLASALAQLECPGPRCEEFMRRRWQLGVDRVRGGGTVVHGHASTNPSNGVQANAHGSHVFGGPNNGAQSLGGGLSYQNPNGLHGSVDATHNRGHGTAYSGTVGHSSKVGPGTLSVGAGASSVPGSSHVQGHVGATYSVPLP